MKNAPYAMLVASLLSCSACALTQLQRENEASEQRIADKEQRLATEKAQQVALLDQQKRLLSDLENKQMTLRELNTKLEDLQRQNASINTDNEAQRAKKERLELQLRQYRADVAALEKNTSLPNADKQKRIDELKKQISAQMKLMLAL